MQKAVTEWTDEKDKDNKKSFNAFRNHMLKEHQAAHHNKQALGSIGIANSIENFLPRMHKVDTDITFIKDTLTKTINCVSKLQQANNVRHTSNTPSEGADKTEEMTRKILAAITNVQIESQKSPKQLKIEELTKQLNQLKNRNNNGGGGGGGSSSRNKKPFWEKMKEKMKNRPKVDDPDPTCTKYCSLCGVQANHDNGDCSRKENQYW